MPVEVIASLGLVLVRQTVWRRLSPAPGSLTAASLGGFAITGFLLFRGMSRPSARAQGGAVDWMAFLFVAAWVPFSSLPATRPHGPGSPMLEVSHL